MTIANEFYHSKHGRAFHGDLGDTSKFVGLGLNAAYDTIVQLKHMQVEGKEKTIGYLAYTHLLYLKQKEKLETEVYPAIVKKIKDKTSHVYYNKLTELGVGCLGASLLISSAVVIAQLETIPKHPKNMTALHNDIPNLYPLRIPLEEIPFIDQSLLTQHYFYTVNDPNLGNNLQDNVARSKKSYAHYNKSYNNKTNNNHNTNYNTNHNIISAYSHRQQYKHTISSAFRNKKEAFTKLLFVAEGKSKIFYKDNIGVATAYGWNPTTNPKEFNLPIAKAMGFNTKEQKAIADISASPARRPISYVPASLKKIILSDKQLKQSAAIMMVEYEKEFINVLKVKARQKNQDFDKLMDGYELLPNNQQAVLLHMTYKVGAHNLLKYNQFFDHLFKYINHPTQKNMQLVSNNFEYNYKTKDGQKVRDTRVEKKHGIFFSDCTIDKNTKNKSSIQEQIAEEKNQSCQDLFVKAEEKTKKPSKKFS